MAARHFRLTALRRPLKWVGCGFALAAGFAGVAGVLDGVAGRRPDGGNPRNLAVATSGTVAARVERDPIEVVGGAMVAALARSTNGNGRGAASLIGALVGGVAGNEVDQWVRAGRNVDAVTRPDDSRSTEARRIDSPVIDPGERVRIVEAATGIK